MAIRRKWINYKVYAPNYEPGKSLLGLQTRNKSAFGRKKAWRGIEAAKEYKSPKQGHREADWWIDRVWEWTGKEFVNITDDASKGLL